MERNLSQVALAKLAGYSERLVRKAEAGGALDIDTIKNFAQAFSSGGSKVEMSDLCVNHVEAARLFVEAFEKHGTDMLPLIEDLVSERFEWCCPGDSSVIPYAGNWVGIDGFAAWLQLFFGIFDCCSSLSGTRFTVGEDCVSVRFDQRFVRRDQVHSNVWANLHLEFENHLIVRAEIQHDTASLLRAAI